MSRSGQAAAYGDIQQPSRTIANLFCSLFGFLFGVTLSGASAYYYVIDEYKLANDMLTEDIYVCLAGLTTEQLLTPDSLFKQPYRDYMTM